MPLFRFGFTAMACENEILIDTIDEAYAQNAANAAIAEVRRIEQKFSRYRNDSVVSEINRNAGKYWVAIDTETAALLRYADACFVQSDGLFDITSGVLRRAWNFRAGSIPSAETIAALLPLIGWGHVQRTDTAIYLPLAGMEVDFGGFGKEYAVDRACAVLRANGASSALVNLGGDLGATGAQGDGSAWRTGIRHPRQENALLARLELPGGALATSGDYERFMIVNNIRYSHLLDPCTGWPVAHTFQCVSARADTCLVAGSTTTIALLKGEAAGQRWLDEMGCAYLAVTASGEVRQVG